MFSLVNHREAIKKFCKFACPKHTVELLALLNDPNLMELAAHSIIWIFLIKPLNGLLLVKQLRFVDLKRYVTTMDEYGAALQENSNRCVETRKTALLMITSPNENPWYQRVDPSYNHANIMEFLNTQDNVLVENLLQRVSRVTSSISKYTDLFFTILIFSTVSTFLKILIITC